MNVHLCMLCVECTLMCMCMFMCVSRIAVVALQNARVLLTLLWVKPIEYYGIMHVLPRCKKCSSYKQLHDCDKEKDFSS